MRIWLDDIRNPNEWGRIGWTWTKTCDETIELLKHNDVTSLDLDHDLAIEATIGMPCKEKTGYDVLLWIEEQVVNNPEYVPPIMMFVHTANPAARPRMEAAIQRIKKYIKELHKNE